MDNVEVTIRIDIQRTESEVDGWDQPRQDERGRFRLVLGAHCSDDIDALEQGLLRTNAPALREAFARYLEEESKKSPEGAGPRRGER